MSDNITVKFGTITEKDNIQSVAEFKRKRGKDKTKRKKRLSRGAKVAIGAGAVGTAALAGLAAKKALSRRSSKTINNDVGNTSVKPIVENTEANDLLATTKRERSAKLLAYKEQNASAIDNIKKGKRSILAAGTKQVKDLSGGRKTSIKEARKSRVPSISSTYRTTKNRMDSYSRAKRLVGDKPDRISKRGFSSGELVSIAEFGRKKGSRDKKKRLKKALMGRTIAGKATRIGAVGLAAVGGASYLGARAGAKGKNVIKEGIDYAKRNVQSVGLGYKAGRMVGNLEGKASLIGGAAKKAAIDTNRYVIKGEKPPIQKLTEGYSSLRQRGRKAEARVTGTLRSIGSKLRRSK